MKMPVKKFISRFGLTFFVLVAALFWVAGCASLVPCNPDPLAGWKVLTTGEARQLNQSIKDDSQKYIHTLPSDDQNGLTESSLWYYEDGTGQHAVRFETGKHGTSWAHVLIYDKDNKRTKVIKYMSGHYAS